MKRIRLAQIRIVITLFICFFSTVLLSQDIYTEWAIELEGTTQNKVSSITHDENNNIYCVGTFENTLDADPSSNNFDLISNGNKDYYVAKYNSNGELIWAHSFGSTGIDNANKIKYHNGKLFISLINEFILDLNPDSVDVFNFTYNSLSPAIQILDTSGNFVHAFQYGTFNNMIKDIEFNDLNNTFYIVSRVYGTFNPEAVPNSTSFNANGITITKFSSINFAFHSFSYIESITGNLMPYNLELDLTNSAVYINFTFQSTVDCDPGSGIYNLSSNGNTDIAIVKLNLNLGFIDAFNIGGSATDIIGDMAVDSFGSILIVVILNHK